MTLKNKNMISDARAYEVVRAPVITEKATTVQQNNQYVFKVAPDADKSEIKQAIEKLFKVTVLSVNTLNQKGKNVVFRGRPGKRVGHKKAFVTLKSGQILDTATGL